MQHPPHIPIPPPRTLAPPPPPRVIRRKQNGDNGEWTKAWANIAGLVSREHAELLVEDAAARVRAVCAGRRVGYAWSGGKDSQVLRLVMERVGVQRCVFAMSRDLEYPEFLGWVTNNMPELLDVEVAEEMTLPWLARHPQWIFPQRSAVAMNWFANIQHAGQIRFMQRHRFDLLIMGRRRADQNFTGPHGVYQHPKTGVVRFSPIVDWTQEEVMAVCHYFDLPMAPFYGWVNGWVVGTGAWPARQFTGSRANGWREINAIDRGIIERAAAYLPEAERALQELPPCAGSLATWAPSSIVLSQSR